MIAADQFAVKQTRCRTSPARPLRRGFTFLEFMVALVVLGVALAGVFPLMVMSSRGIESLELRYARGSQNSDWFSPVFRPDLPSAGVASREAYDAWYVVPSPDPWARKLGAVSTFSRAAPATSLATILDDGDAVYSPASSAVWSVADDPNAYGGHYRRHEPSSPTTDTATWTFSNVAPGPYAVMVTWPAAADLATDASYTVYDGATVVPTNPVNQANPPSGATYHGRPWTIVVSRYNFSNSTVRVVLSNKVDKAVAADAVRLVPVQVATIRAIDKSFNSEAVTLTVKLP